MSTYNFGNINGPANIGDHGRIEINPYAPASEALVRLSDGLLEQLHAEYPGLVRHGETIRGAMMESVGDGGPPNRGRIRSALEAISIGAAAGTGSLTFTQQLMHVMGL
ncbi:MULTISPECIES: hypothetical protein [unclassified Streptomyces]|uniref:hypothetical protein n=1 Tax=unclassified Streptomyces TaxID=2593676 RepID=UPI00119EAF4C|nr:hypothetical protein [Streptomyces sp. BK340]TVZ80030.1 hypothetical protein FB157_13077 [Streptomyces sp. BK340]